MFDVIVDFIFENGLLFISIENLSDAPAFDVRVTFDRRILGPDGEEPINDLALFSRLAFLAPRKRIRTFLGSSHAFFERNESTRISVRVSHKALTTGEDLETTFLHDLEIYKDINYIVQN